MKKMYKKEEGVSPVIATILMVAITVVLAATVWLMVSGYMSPTTKPLQGYLNYDTSTSNPDSGWFNFTVQMSQPTDGLPDSAIVIHIGSTDITSTSNAWGYIDNNGDGKLSNGDELWIHYTSLTNYHGVKVTIGAKGAYSGTISGTIP